MDNYAAPRTCRKLVATLTLALPFAFASSQDDTGASAAVFDPFFTDTVDIGGEKVEIEVNLPPAKNPRSLYRIALDRYDSAPPSHLSKRIALLEEALSVYPDDPKSMAATLDELKAYRSRVLADIHEAGQVSQDLRSALQLIAPHTQVLSGDPSLVVVFLNSDFARQFERQIARLGETKDLDALIEVNALVQQSGANRVLGQRFNRAIRSALATLVAEKWLGADSRLLPGENFLAGRLLDDPKRKLSVRLDFPEEAPDNLRRNLRRSFERRWGEDFQFLPSDTTQPTDFALKVQTSGIETEQDVDAVPVASTIPGQISEEPNPEFMELVEKYEKAAKRYEIALQTYEAEYERYIENAKDEKWSRAQQDLDQAQSLANSITPSGGPGGPGPAYEAAQANLQIARAVANSVTSSATPEPIKPRPTHLNVLDELYLIPSTIVTSEESTPYEYTKKTLNYLLRAHATVELVSEAIRVSRPIQLQQERIWTENEGVSPRDPSAEPGDFSPQELNSALDLFSLAFGADCAKAFTTMLAEARAAAQPQAFGPEELPKVTLAIALQAQEAGAKPLALTTEEVQQLATLAKDPGMSPRQFRSHCLALVTQRLDSAPTLTREQIESQLN